MNGDTRIHKVISEFHLKKSTLHNYKEHDFLYTRFQFVNKMLDSEKLTRNKKIKDMDKLGCSRLGKFEHRGDCYLIFWPHPVDLPSSFFIYSVNSKCGDYLEFAHLGSNYPIYSKEKMLVFVTSGIKRKIILSRKVS